MNKKIVLFDILFYAVIPYLLWAYGREPLGDYWAIILSTVPGFIYTVFRFFAERQFNILGLYIISSLVLETIVNLLSQTAESMIWNQIFLGYGFSLVFLISMLINKPLTLYFMVDYAYLMGHKRSDSKALYKRKELFVGFQLLTLLFVIRFLFQNSLKAWLLTSHGVEAYGQMLIYLRISGWIFTGIISISFMLLIVRINKLVEKLYGTT